jgi:membrane associated rhomboid family serine protease
LAETARNDQTLATGASYVFVGSGKNVRLGALTIVAVMVVSSVTALLSPRLLERAVLRPDLIARRSDYWRLVTSGFVHADITHLLFNLITFYSFAFTLERVMGTARFISLYFGGLLASGIGTCIKHRDEPNYASLGASGAILAVLFASIVYFPRSRLLILPIPIPIPAPLFAVVYLAWSYYSSRNSKDRINHDAHLAGALTGIAFVALTDPQSFVALLRYLTG